MKSTTKKLNITTILKLIGIGTYLMGALVLAGTSNTETQEKAAGTAAETPSATTETPGTAPETAAAEQAMTAEENIAKTKAEYYTPGKEVHLTDMNGEYRFCEVGLITGTTKDNAVINIWNSTGSGDCSPEQFAKLDADQLAKQFNAKMWLNPSRRWTFDEFWANEVGVEKVFGDIKMLWMGVLGAKEVMQTTVKGSYFPNYIYRNTQFKFNKGSRVYLLDAPDGEVFVMQSYTHHFDERVSKDKLKDLGSILKLPEGWKFRSVVLDRELIVNQKNTNNLAHVLQDNIHNTYQGSDGGKAFNFVP